MPRAENSELQEKLRKTIRALLCAQGFDATSYQAIADQADVSRAVVQYYYPRKMDLAIEFLNDVLAVTAEVLGIEGYARRERLSPDDAFRMGCLYYGFLLSADGGRRFFYDILKNRELTDKLMSLHYAWSLENVDPSRPSFDRRTEDVIVAWGGFYELMYFSIKQGIRFDIPSRLAPVVKTFMGSNNEHAVEDANDLKPDPRLTEQVKTRILGGSDSKKLESVGQ